MGGGMPPGMEDMMDMYDDEDDAFCFGGMGMGMGDLPGKKKPKTQSKA